MAKALKVDLGFEVRGIESQGMILMAEGKGGRLVFVQPGEEVEPGSTVN